MKTKRFIHVEKPEMERLMKVFNCSYVTVYNALNYKADTARSSRIRYMALMPKTDGGCGGMKFVAVDGWKELQTNK